MRVLVTRALTAAERTAHRVEAAGHEAVLAPVIGIVATDARPSRECADALIVTSANVFAAENGRLADLRHLPVFAVGQATASAARGAGFRDIRTGEGDANALACLVRLTLSRPAALLYLAGQDRKRVIEQELTEAGYALDIVDFYRAEAKPGWDEAVLRDLAHGRIEGVLHFSARSAELALRFAHRAELITAFLRLRHFCLAADVASPLRAAGAERILVAPRPDESGLLTLLPPQQP